MRLWREHWKLGVVLLLLVLCQFTLRPAIGDARLERVAPDFLLLALLVYAIQARPGQGAMAGFVVGLATDSLSMAAFGAGALAHTVVGYLATWGKAVFFADNLFINAVFFFVGTWVRDIMVLLVAQHAGGTVLWWQLGYLAPLRALTTAVAGVLTLLVFRRWLNIRVSE